MEFYEVLGGSTAFIVGAAVGAVAHSVAGGCLAGLGALGLVSTTVALPFMLLGAVFGGQEGREAFALNMKGGAQSIAIMIAAPFVVIAGPFIGGAVAANPGLAKKMKLRCQELRD